MKISIGKKRMLISFVGIFCYREGDISYVPFFFCTWEKSARLLEISLNFVFAFNWKIAEKFWDIFPPWKQILSKR